MKTKIIALALVAVMLCALALGSSYAYLMSSDGAKNTMVVGNVSIVQNEKDRTGADFGQGQTLIPAKINGALALEDGIWTNSIDNEIDKFITVTNNGTQPAFVRTIVLFEDKEGNTVLNQIHTNEGQPLEWVMVDANTKLQVTLNNVIYTVAVATYTDALAVGATTAPSLKQFYLDPLAGNEWYAAVNGQYDILALSQAVQSTGFDGQGEGATVALDTAFGAVDGTNVASWFAAIASTQP